MSSFGSAVPPEVQEQANASALELWTSIRNDAAREGVDGAALEAVKPAVLHALQLAFGRGALISARAGIEQLQTLAKRRGNRGFMRPR